MKIRIKTRILLSLITSLVFQLSLANTAITIDSIPLDSSIRYGKLPNGLSYYIKPIDNPATGLNLRLVVKAGFFQEGSGESEFAHIVEHLAFTAGRNISTKKSSNVFDEAGIRLAQLNGLTANDYTDYFVQTSKENPLGIAVALDFFQDILWNLDLNEKNIDLERNTVLGEAKGGDFRPGIYSYLMEKQITGWGAEPPKDYEDHIKTFKSEKLIDFYKKWYRPDLMAIVIVGNIDHIDKLENELKEKFTKGKSSNNPPATAVDQINYLSKAPQFYEKELQSDNDYLEYKPIQLSLYFRQFENELSNNNPALKDQLIKNLFIDLLNKRYLQVVQEYNTFLSIRTKFLEPPAALRLEIIPKEGLKKDNFITAFKTLKEIEKYGFSTKEFNEGKAEYLNSIRETDTLQIYYWKNQIIQHFVNGKSLPKEKPEILGKILQKLNKKEFHSEIKNYIKEEPEDISIVAYKGDRALDNPENNIRKWITEVNKLSVEPPATSEQKLVLMGTAEIEKLKEAQIKALKTKIPEAKSYQMKNGLRVILKPLKQKSSSVKEEQNSISFRGFSSHGIDCFSEKDYFSVINAPSILKNSGVGTLDKFELKRYLDRKGFEGHVSVFIENDASGIKANISLKELEIALQLVYLYFKSPNFNDIAFEDWKTEQKINMAYKNYPAENFETAIREFLSKKDFTPKGRKFIEGLEKTDLDRSWAIYKQLFSDPSNFTFLFSGNFNEEVVLKLCQKYLGNLPVSSETLRSNCNSTTIKSQIKPIKSKIFYSRAPLRLAMVRIAYIKKTNSSFLNWREEIKLEILRRSMAELLMRRLRFESEEGGTYQILALRDHSNFYKYNEVYIDFNSYPEDTERLIEESKNVVDNLKNSAVEISLFEKLKKVQSNKKVTNGVTLRKMYGVVKNEISWFDEEEKKVFIESLRPKDIQETALKYLNQKPIIFKMLPQEFINKR